MSFCSQTAKFLAEAGAARLRDYLADEVPDEATGKSVMTHLLQTRPGVANQVLCLFYDVAPYQADKVFDGVPANEAGKWFVSTVVGGPVDSDVTIPLADTEQGAYDLAVQHLKLRDMFFGDTVAQPA